LREGRWRSYGRRKKTIAEEEKIWERRRSKGTVGEEGSEGGRGAGKGTEERGQ
jgi:hypothetical protein